MPISANDSTAGRRSEMSKVTKVQLRKALAEIATAIKHGLPQEVTEGKSYVSDLAIGRLTFLQRSAEALLNEKSCLDCALNVSPLNVGIVCNVGVVVVVPPWVEIEKAAMLGTDYASECGCYRER